MTIVNLPLKTSILSKKKRESEGLKARKVLWVFFYWVNGGWKGEKSCKKRENEKQEKRKSVDFREIFGLF